MKPDVDIPGHRGIFEWGSLPNLISYAVAVLALLIAVVTVYQAVGKRKHDVRIPLFIFWVIAPPCWFFVEFMVLFKTYGKPGSFEFFKYEADLGSKVWVGFVTLLTATLLKDRDDKKEADSAAESDLPGTTDSES